ncbi:MAG: hypothetical protein QUT30_20160, partial [Acidobacteriota bacterium]|nr:hypothetical protein [Acidobacteriota bacterium]
MMRAEPQAFGCCASFSLGCTATHRWRLRRRRLGRERGKRGSALEPWVSGGPVSYTHLRAHETALCIS